MTKMKAASTHQENKQLLNDACMEIYAANIIGGQWTLAICCQLLNGALRFGELRKKLPNISERMLTLQLRKMETNRLVKRTVYPSVPPHVEYELTESGLKLRPILEQLEIWGDQHLKLIASMH
ncbi:winged helix-turn-helix transcriptional regulator [Chitinophaga lutea]